MKKQIALALVLYLSAAQLPARSAVTAITGPGAQQRQPDVVLYQSPQYQAKTTREDHFQGMLNLAPNAEKLPLTLVIANGAPKSVPFNWFRITVNGIPVASEKDLAGKREGAVDLTGRLQPGGGQILIDAAGEPGATLSFSLQSPQVVLTAIEPSQVQPGGKMFLLGANFSSDESQDSVLINGVPAQVLSAGPHHIAAVVPGGIHTDQADVKVVVDSIESKPVSVSVAAPAPPVLTGTNFWMAPPGAYLTISGQNFGDPSKLQVFFQGTQAQIVNASPVSATVIVPQWSYGSQELNIPLYVVSDGVRSLNALPFDIGPKYLSNTLPPYPGDGSSQSGSQAGSQALGGGY